MKTHTETTVFFRCPGCNAIHSASVGYNSFNFDDDYPTIEFDGGPLGVIVKGERGAVCHSFIRDGMISFAEKSTHSLAGQTVALPELTPEDFTHGR